MSSRWILILCLQFAHQLVCVAVVVVVAVVVPVAGVTVVGHVIDVIGDASQRNRRTSKYLWTKSMKKDVQWKTKAHREGAKYIDIGTDEDLRYKPTG